MTARARSGKKTAPLTSRPALAHRPAVAAARPPRRPRGRARPGPGGPRDELPLEALDRPVRRRAAVRQVKVEHFKPALEAAMARAARRRSTRSPSDPAAPTFENTHRRAGGRRAGARPRRGTIYGVWASTMNTPEFQAVEREMAPKLAAFDDEITQNEKLFARIEAVYNSPREGEADARAAAARLAATTRASSAPARSSTRAAKKRAGRDQPAARRALHRRSARTCSADEDELRARPRRARPTSPACPTRCAPARRPRPRRAGTKGKWAITNTRSSHGAVPHLLDRARPAREGLAQLRQPRRQRRRARQQRRSSPRS